MAQNGQQEMFVRNATGLVRELSAFDAFNLVFSAVLIPVGISQTLGFAPAAFQGSNVMVAYVLAAIVMFFFGWVYLSLTVAMPRSGGDYVWVSRMLHPSVGFVTNVSLTFVFLTWISFNFTTMLSYFAPAAFYVWGASSSTVAAISSPTSQIIVSTVLTILFAFLMSMGTRRVAVYMRVLFWIVWIGMGIWIVGLLITGHGAFATHFQQTTGVSATQIMTIAQQNGYHATSGINWGMTFLAMIYAFQTLTGFQWTGYFAGEIRNVRRTATTSILGGLVAAALLYIIGSGLVYKAVGYNFFNALTYMGFHDASKLPASVQYVLPAMTKYLVLPALLKAYVALSFLLAILWWTPTGFMLGTRNLFAWAFDRMMPQSLADVSERFHTPVKAIFTIAVVVEIINFLNVYAGLSSFLVNIIAVMSLAFIFVSLAATVFPYTRKDLFDSAPSLVRWKLAGIPFVSIAGVIGILTWVFVLVVAFKASQFGLQVTTKAMVEAFAVPVLAIIYYVIMAAVRKSQHIDMSATFRALPPE
ncbi:APC family permease [Alicyclobacillus sp. ALC3]|uniref:APC family permease n=1 Tax=Alicyclobacillus sp. ALC3 TaxID=2796143 RepID=UPI002377D8A8|nr:APC family permease [Alicyclobacillus sp. ALC3]WDL95335.1 APC family permease [Alicyclobacillus sp. ALC3]